MSAARHREQGAAGVWVLACGALVLFVGVVGALRAEAVLARHHVESAADLAALAAAGQIGTGADLCAAARKIAVANSASVVSCVPSLSADGRSGCVRVVVRDAVWFPVLGPRTVTARARAGRSTGEQAVEHRSSK